MDRLVSMPLMGANNSQTNIFEGEFQGNIDNWVIRWWDDGLPTMPAIEWENHDDFAASSF